MNVMIHTKHAPTLSWLWKLLFEENEPDTQEFEFDSEPDRTIINRLRDVLAIR